MVQEFSGIIMHTARCKRKSEIQDVGRSTGSTFEIRLPLSSGGIRNSPIEFLDPENRGLAVGTALISSLETEI